MLTVKSATDFSDCAKSQMWADTNKELLISVKITEGMRSDGGCSSPSVSVHQSCKVEFMSRRWKMPLLVLCACTAFFYFFIYFLGGGLLGLSTTQRMCGPWLSDRLTNHTDVQSDSHRLRLSGSCEESSRCMWSHRISQWVMEPCSLLKTKTYNRSL